MTEAEARKLIFGDRVLWVRKTFGTDVERVAATVVQVTAKRVTIEIEETVRHGQTSTLRWVKRSVQFQNLELHNIPSWGPSEAQTDLRVEE